ncbi:hypothetical protein Tco_1401596 [Tanacetum coccineum]
MILARDYRLLFVVNYFECELLKGGEPLGAICLGSFLARDFGGRSGDHGTYAMSFDRNKSKGKSQSGAIKIGALCNKSDQLPVKLDHLQERGKRRLPREENHYPRRECGCLRSARRGRSRNDRVIIRSGLPLARSQRRKLEPENS